MTPAMRLPGMKPWACSYDRHDGRYSITLHGADSFQVLNDNCVELPGLTIDGELIGTMPGPERNM